MASSGAPAATAIAPAAQAAGTTPTMLTFDAVDRVGNAGITFECPAVFISADSAFDASTTGPLTAVIAWSTFGQPADLFTLDFGGQPIGLADSPAPGKEGLVSKQVTTLRLVLLGPPPGVSPSDLRAAGQVGGFPHIAEASVTDPVVDSLRGTSAPQGVLPHPDYLAFGYGNDNVGGSYLQMRVPVNLGYQGGGGSLVSPELIVEEYNAELGISAPLDDLSAGWNPLENLQITSKLFGAIPIAWVLPEVIAFDVDLGAQPDLPSIGIDLNGTPPTSAPFAFCWEPPLRTLAIGDSPTFIVTDDLPNPDEDLLDPFGDDETRASFKVSQTVSFTDAADGEALLEVTIENVVVQLPPLVPLVQLYIRQVSLTVSATDGEALDVDIADVKFTGVLNFLDLFEEFIGGLLGLLPGLGPDSEFIELYAQIQTPQIPLGVFNLQPFTAITRLQLPTGDDGVTTVELQLGEFAFTILGFGGKGEFHIIAAPHPDGIIYLFAELAATVEVSVGMFIANAYASCSFGARLQIEQVTARNPKTNLMESIDEWTISIFVEISAGLSVLGLISLSGTVELAAEYNVTLRIFTGRVTATVAVDYLFGETSKQVTFEESFLVSQPGTTGSSFAQIGGPTPGGPGSGGAGLEEPTFGDRYSEAEWLEYCGKFA